MVNHGIGRLPVVSREAIPRLLGMLTRSDVLSTFQRGLREAELQRPTLGWTGKRPVVKSGDAESA